MQDVTIIIPQAGGAVPEIWESLGSASINVEAAVSFAREHHRVVHVVVGDDVAEQARQLLADGGFLIVDVREVLVVPLDDRPGGLGDVTRTAVDAGVDVYMLALATQNRVMLGAVNLETARAAFGL
jgi:hypothetical protein